MQEEVAPGGPPSALRMKLMFLSGAEAGQSLPLPPRSYRLGTDPACDIVLKDRTVSRQHLTLEVKDNGVLARDLGSRNGSFCEGMRFTELEVRLGAVLRLGA
ncbi:FHA domain-containing protein, partial [Hyalangium sp.]|uniref:FHA domain-containing protein n=1 Tax=Hyalangium sp. TaxID=2028555 RepID=UPI002D5BE519